MTEEDVSKATAAEAIGCSQFGVSWLLLCEELRRGFSEVDGRMMEMVQWSSVEDYLRWREQASPRQRRVRSLRNVIVAVLHPVIWVLRVFEVISPG